MIKAHRTVGKDFLLDCVSDMTDKIEVVGCLEFNERHRYLPESLTRYSGHIDFSLNPFMREIIDCFDVDSPVREVNLKKGVQITYTTALESGALYYLACVKTRAIMYATADKGLAEARIENNFIPMLNHSGFGDIVQSSDEGNSRKTGKTKSHIQVKGGGYLLPFGAQNANKMRSFSVAVLLCDEIDAWPAVVGKDGDPIKLFNDRCAAQWDIRKIFRGSTPLIKGTSKIDAQYIRGDQRHYFVRCFRCGHAQILRWNTLDKKTGLVGGILWELEGERLIEESVRYACSNCGHDHFEHDKVKLFATESGAEWRPTAQPVSIDIRSYHLPALYSPLGMQPWSKCVSDYLEAYDTVNKKVKDIGKYQVFYNNILAESFERIFGKIKIEQIFNHRRLFYKKGQIPNAKAEQYSGSEIIFLCCTVDVHKDNLAVAVWGVCKDMIMYLIDYQRLLAKSGEDCGEISCSAWAELRKIIEERVFFCDHSLIEYKVCYTFIDAGYSHSTVLDFCGQYGSGVVPILGRDRPSKSQNIKEFAEFTTKSGTTGYRITVDHYKDRIAPVLRREWYPEEGDQRGYHLNIPIDATDKELKELVAESRRKKTLPTGEVVFYWHRSGSVANELWDLLCYAHALSEVLAYNICIQHHELDNVDWPVFWRYAADSITDALFGRSRVKANG